MAVAGGQAILPALIVGLGNPGGDYEDTRHNAGFAVVDELIGRLCPAAEAAHAWNSRVSRVRHAGRRLVLMKPLTFMNVSGDAVAKAVRALDLLPEEIMIVCDCLDLPLGCLRLRQRGSSGGHRGLESVIQALGTNHFPRLRLGVGRPPGDVIEYVLGAWLADELPIVRDVVERAAEAILFAVRRGVVSAMDRYNGMDSATTAGTGTEDKESGH